ncbi:MAG: fibronectin type III domain-containing protein [Bdellovibrionales bacterium]|nr:fibronectin type III domain-containing protein [Bdellovibrionales bacterium]
MKHWKQFANNLRNYKKWNSLPEWARTLTVVLSVASMTACGAKALQLANDGSLGGGTSGGSGGTSFSGGNSGTVYPVTILANAIDIAGGYDNVGLANPFSSTSYSFHAYSDIPATDQNTPASFSYTYPSYNFSFNQARLALESNRDTSGTEAIFVAGTGLGILSGINPQFLKGTADGIRYRIDSASTNAQTNGFPYSYGSGGAPFPNRNPRYMSVPARYYRVNTINFQDYNLADLIQFPVPAASPSVQPGDYPSARDLVKDGFFRLISTDDTPLYSGRLFINGFTWSMNSLSCANSSTYSFRNIYVHNDWNSTGRYPTTLPSERPFDGATPSGVAHSTDFFFEAGLPQVDIANVTITEARLVGHGQTVTGATTATFAAGTNYRAETLNATGQIFRRNTAVSPKAALVVNGVAVFESGFDTNLFVGSEVTEYISGAGQTYFENWVTTNVPDTNSNTLVPYANSLDLIQIFGASKVKNLISQGSLNFSFIGSIVAVPASGTTHAVQPPNHLTGAITRTPTTFVYGPELKLAGTYYTPLCTITNESGSPLTDGTPPPVLPGDLNSPVIISLSAINITNTTATIQWATDEGADSQVAYGIGTPSSTTTLDPTLVTLHQVNLTGLTPYTTYTIQAITKDGNANPTTSNYYLFTTKR